MKNDPTKIRRVPLAPLIGSPVWLEEMETWPDWLKDLARERVQLYAKHRKGRNTRQRCYWAYRAYRSLLVTYPVLRSGFKVEPEEPKPEPLDRTDEEVEENARMVRRYRPAFMQRQRSFWTGAQP